MTRKMSANTGRSLQMGVSLSGLLVLGWVLTSLAAEPGRHGISLPTDWSHSHLIFAGPASAQKLARISTDPRYWQQLQRREQAFMQPAIGADVDSVGIAPPIFKWYGKNLKRDWGEVMGTGASAGAGNYPAKFSFRGTT